MRKKKIQCSLKCITCSFCFRENHKGLLSSFRCRKCEHHCILSSLHGDATVEMTAMKSIELVRVNGCCHQEAEDDETFAHEKMNRWFTFIVHPVTRAEMVTHCIEAMREFHVKLVCMSFKTNHEPLIDMIMRFHHQLKGRIREMIDGEPVKHRVHAS